MNTRNFLQKVCLILMVGMTLVGCSKGDEDVNFISTLDDMNNYSNINIMSMTGEYSGQWTLNGKNVDAEDSYFSLCANKKYSFNFTTFPFKAIAMLALSQNSLVSSQKSFSLSYLSIAKLTTSMIEKVDEDLSTHIDIATDIRCVGYSENMVYFELSSYAINPFLRYPFVVTFSNGEYYVMVLDVVPSKSTLTLDSSSRTINFVCNIPQIEIYDSEGNKTIIEQNPELVLTFTSTNKTKAAENGD